MKIKKTIDCLLFVCFSTLLFTQCKDKPSSVVSQPASLVNTSVKIGNLQPVPNVVNYNIPVNTSIVLNFNNAVDQTTVNNAISIKQINNTNVPVSFTYAFGDSTIIIRPQSSLNYLTRYNFDVNANLKSVKGGTLNATISITFNTAIDSSYKFPAISDSVLLDKIQQQTFKYFWNFGHPISGMARERNSSGETVTTGGTGFGIMAVITGIHRSFITRSQGLSRIQQLVSFLKNTAQRFHGAYPHWMNGTTGIVQPFSQKDDGADLVETSYLMQGLICARQYFNQNNIDEINLKNDINSILNSVEWDWFRNGNQNQLYWHWSPNYNWDMNMPIRGWNECLITYVMAASSITHGIPKIVYDNGFAQNGNIRNGSSYYGYNLPLGSDYGGPLFFAHYSFLGIDPRQLSDNYANYWTQNQNQSLINYSFCVANPNNYFGYSNSCWGLTASDIMDGYTASSPTNDIGVMAPTAAISSMPYTPTESMRALKFYYYILGDRLFGEYGFYDAFSLQENWFANSTLAIDQGPIVVMLENYRSGLLWSLFTGAPEIKNGMRSLGFLAPYL